mmetsp:Transcript_23346/g.41452  ORF Transcript_23346/g.41452 Transcript_23346/m.41452 type:complete len:218 (-) Transcript_23346:78-731(-)
MAEAPKRSASHDVPTIKAPSEPHAARSTSSGGGSPSQRGTPWLAAPRQGRPPHGVAPGAATLRYQPRLVVPQRAAPPGGRNVRTAPPHIRFRGAESIASVHLIDQEQPAGNHLSRRRPLGTTGDLSGRAAHPHVTKRILPNKNFSSWMGTTSEHLGSSMRGHSAPPGSSALPPLHSAGASSRSHGRNESRHSDSGRSPPWALDTTLDGTFARSRSRA